MCTDGLGILHGAVLNLGQIINVVLNSAVMMYNFKEIDQYQAVCT